MELLNCVLALAVFLLCNLEDIRGILKVGGLETIGIAGHVDICGSDCGLFMLWFKLLGDCM